MVDDGRTTDGRTPDHGHPISSPCEPDYSGELKILKQCFVCFFQYMYIVYVIKPRYARIGS